MISFEARKRLAILYTLAGATGGLPVFISHGNLIYAIIALLSLLALLWVFRKNKWVRSKLLIAITTSITVGLITLYLFSTGNSSLDLAATVSQLLFLLLSAVFARGIYYRLLRGDIKIDPNSLN